jgi:hypothetical protein
MNRRELFAGAGAAALSAAVPVVPAGPITATEIRGLQSRAFEGLKPRFHTDLTTGTTSVWLVS